MQLAQAVRYVRTAHNVVGFREFRGFPLTRAQTNSIEQSGKNDFLSVVL